MTMQSRRIALASWLAFVTMAGCHRSSDKTEPTPVQDIGPQARSFPGVEAIRVSSGGVRIRIISGFSPNRLPLYVVDGAPVRVGPGGTITWIELDEIESIEFLKDPAETLVYGPPGANGVIVIKTRMNR